jgi:hypothetical protein
MGESQLTKEQQEAQDRAAAERAQGEIITYEFLDAHLDDFDRANPANVKALTDYMLGKKYAWTRDNLERSFKALVVAGELSAVEPPATEVKPAGAVAVIQAFPWGYELTSEDLHSMRGSEMRRWLGNRTWRTEFQRQVKNAQKDSQYLIRRNI